MKNHEKLFLSESQSNVLTKLPRKNLTRFLFASYASEHVVFEKLLVNDPNGRADDIL